VDVPESWIEGTFSLDGGCLGGIGALVNHQAFEISEGLVPDGKQTFRDRGWRFIEGWDEN
jgi:hypothetical protein